MDAVDRELYAYFEKYGRLSVHSVFWGGGTPSTLSDNAIDTLSTSIRRYCRLSSDLEWTIEANPESLTAHRLSVFAAAGVNRVSVGIQSFLSAELALLGRTHTAQGIPGVLDRIRCAGIGNINMDFIYGLPGQTIRDLDQSLRIALDLGSTHLSAYALSIEPGTVYAKTGVVTANDDIQLRMYREIRRQLLAAGYQQYEVSAFAKPGYRSRHNMTYWRYSPYIGLGPSAASYFDGMAYQQVSSLDRYCQAPVPPAIRNRVEMSPEDLSAHFLIANLRRSEGVTYRHISSVFGVGKWGEMMCEFGSLRIKGCCAIAPIG